MHHMRILALVLGCGLVAAVMAEPPPRDIYTFQGDMYIESWDLASASFDLPPPVSSVVIAAILEEGVRKLAADHMVRWNTFMIADKAESSRLRCLHAMLWYEKGLDDFRGFETGLAFNDRPQRPGGKQGYLTGSEYRYPRLC